MCDDSHWQREKEIKPQALPRSLYYRLKVGTKLRLRIAEPLNSGEKTREYLNDGKLYGVREVLDNLCQNLLEKEIIVFLVCENGRDKLEWSWSNCLADGRFVKRYQERGKGQESGKHFAWCFFEVPRNKSFLRRVKAISKEQEQRLMEESLKRWRGKRRKKMKERSLVAEKKSRRLRPLPILRKSSKKIRRATW